MNIEYKDAVKAKRAGLRLMVYSRIGERWIETGKDDIEEWEGKEFRLHPDDVGKWEWIKECEWVEADRIPVSTFAVGVVIFGSLFLAIVMNELKGCLAG